MEVTIEQATKLTHQLLSYDLLHYQTLDDYLNAILQKRTRFIPQKIVIEHAAFELDSPKLVQLINAFANLSYKLRYALTQAVDFALVPDGASALPQVAYDLILDFKFGTYLQMLLLSATDDEVNENVQTILTLRHNFKTIVGDDDVAVSVNQAAKAETPAATPDSAVKTVANTAVQAAVKTVAAETANNSEVTDNEQSAADTTENTGSANSSAPADNKQAVDNNEQTNAVADDLADDDHLFDFVDKDNNDLAESDSPKALTQTDNASDGKTDSQPESTTNSAPVNKPHNDLLEEIEHNYDGEGVESETDTQNQLDFNDLLQTVTDILRPYVRQTQANPNPDIVNIPAQTAQSAQPAVTTSSVAIKHDPFDGFFEQQDALVKKALTTSDLSS